MGLAEFQHRFRLIMGTDPDRDLFLSLRDPAAFLARLQRLEHEVENRVSPMQGHTQGATADKLSLAPPGSSEGEPNPHFPALPPRLELLIDTASLSSHGPFILRWVDTESGQVGHLDEVRVLPDGAYGQIAVDTGSLGGRIGAWHIELYLAEDALPLIARIAVTAGDGNRSLRAN